MTGRSASHWSTVFDRHDLLATGGSDAQDEGLGKVGLPQPQSTRSIHDSRRELSTVQTKRIHISPLGFEHDRIVLPAKEYNADHVILLGFITDNIPRPAYHKDAVDDLEAAGITVTQLDCDLFNLCESIPSSQTKPSNTTQMAIKCT